MQLLVEFPTSHSFILDHVIVRKILPSTSSTHTKMRESNRCGYSFSLPIFSMSGNLWIVSIYRRRYTRISSLFVRFMLAHTLTRCSKISRSRLECGLLGVSGCREFVWYGITSHTPIIFTLNRVIVQRTPPSSVLTLRDLVNGGNNDTSTI